MILVREEERARAEQSKKKLLAVYIGVACLYVAAALLLLFLSPDGYVPFMIADIIVTIAFGCYSIFFFSVQYDYALKKYRLLEKVFSAIPEKEYGVFRREAEPITYEGVMMRTLCFEMLGNERAVHVTEEQLALTKGQKYLLEIHAGVLVEIGECDEKAFS